MNTPHDSSNEYKAGPYAYGSGQPGPYTPPPAPQSPKPKMPRWAKMVVIFVGIPMFLIGGCNAILAGAGLAEQAADTTPAPSSTYDPGIYTPEPETTPEAPETTTPPPAPAPKPKATHKPAPPMVPTDGTLLVGKDVKPGTYQTRVLADDFIPRCYWARLKDLDGGFGSIIDNDLETDAGTLMTLTVKRSDYAVEIDCGGAVWTRVR